MDKKEETPSSDHWLLADHIVQPLLVTQHVSPHKAADAFDRKCFELSLGLTSIEGAKGALL